MVATKKKTTTFYRDKVVAQDRVIRSQDYNTTRLWFET